MPPRTTNSSTIRGSGIVTKQDLSDWWETLPPSARLDFKEEKADRPGETSGWRVTASWDHAFQPVQGQMGDH